MRVDLLIACHALMDILVKEIVVLGTHDGRAKSRTKKGRANVMGALLGKVLLTGGLVSIHLITSEDPQSIHRFLTLGSSKILFQHSPKTASLSWIMPQFIKARIG
jgi:hypothetical protein